MAYRNLCFKNVRFYSGLGTLSCDCRGFVVEIAVLEKCKPNKIKGLAIQRTHRREEEHVSDARAICQQHYETIDAVADTARRGHTELEGIEEVLICVICFVVACFSCSVLCSESLALVDRIVEL